MESTFEPTRAAGLARLEAFVPRSGRAYRNLRNHDLGPGRHEHVSGLSPYLRHRLLGEWEVLAAVLERHGAGASEKFVQEVVWRTYWKGWLEHRPRIWSVYLDEVARAHGALSERAPWAGDYLGAIESRTGIEPFDAWTTELLETGYVHNHARMWYASIWIFTLRLPWQLGADFFLRHLLDGDPASNTLSWRWVAGLHTRGKSYLATPGNIERYAGERFFSEGRPRGLERLAKRADALEGPPPPDPVRPTLVPFERADGRAGWLLSEEDLYLPERDRFGALAVLEPVAAEPLPASERVMAFKRDAVADTVTRARESRVAASADAVALDDIAAWARQMRLEHLHMPHVCQGALAARLPTLRQRLSEAGCELRIFTRGYDRLAWPHATKGFFQLKKQIPRLLDELCTVDVGR